MGYDGTEILGVKECGKESNSGRTCSETIPKGVPCQELMFMSRKQNKRTYVHEEVIGS